MNLLLTGAFDWKEKQIEALEKDGWKISYIEREDQDFDNELLKVDAVVCNWLLKNHAIENFINLKCIQLLSAGLERVPLEYIKNNEIVLYNARGVYSIPMAEYAVAGVLQLMKHSNYFYENKNKHVWSKDRNLLELSGKRVCIIGTGSVGREVGKRFAAFTDEVYGIDLIVDSIPYFKEVYLLDELDKQLELSDIVVLTLPLTTETYHMFDEARFRKMKNNSIFVNIARGGLVEEKSLIWALDNILYGAVLDVFEKEPLLENDPLWEIDNLIMTPHNSFVSQNNDERLWSLIYDNLHSFIHSYK